MSKYRSALIVDSDARYLASLSLDPQFGLYEPELLVSGDPKEILTQTGDRYASIYLNPMMHSPGVLAWIETIQKSHPLTPIHFLMESDQFDFPELALKKLGVQGAIKKETHLADFLKAPAAYSVQPTLPPPDLVPTGYIPVRTEELFSGTSSVFDVYVQIASGKMIKVLNANESLGSERAMQYYQSGAGYLFIPQESYRRRLAYTASLAKEIYTIPGLPLKVRAYANIDRGNHLMNSLSEIPVDVAHVEEAEKFLFELFEVISLMGAETKLFLDLCIDDPRRLAHGVRVAVLCALMSRPLKISRKETLKQLGIAGMFHDIGLADEYDYLHQTDRSKMTAEQKMIFEGHPQRGAELLDEMGCMDSLTPQIVAQHHARRDNSGFPKSVAAGSIHLFSELIGLAEECVRWADQQPNISRSQILEKMEKSTFSGFSVKALEFFKGVMTS